MLESFCKLSTNRITSSGTANNIGYLNRVNFFWFAVFRCYCSKAVRTKPTFLKRDSLGRKSYGQPTFETHPHLIAEGEITPLITKSEYQERRHKLLEAIVAYAFKRNKDIKRHLVGTN